MPSWLVTGGCGFIGSHLVEALLARGDRVRVLDDLSSGKRENIPPSAELVIGDVADRDLVARAVDGVDGIFHLAAIASVQRSSEDWLGCHRTNLTGSITVFDCARRARGAAPLPVVYASSAAVYGDNTAVPLRETAALQPLSAYGADKLASELHGRVAWTAHGVPTTGLRFFNVYGPRQDPSSPYSGVIAIFADRFARDAGIDIFGDGQQTRDFIYVEDVVAHLAAAMANLRAGASVFNICTGRATSILELAGIIAKLAGRVARIRHSAARTGDIKASVGDPTTAYQALGLRAQTLIADGLRKTLQCAETTLSSAS
jgi:UDP-glucose 4-epimerase